MKENLRFYDNLAEWEKRKSMILVSILKKVGICARKRSEPIECVQTKITQMDGYIVKNVYWQTLKRYYVAGNIFLPAEVVSLIPVVLLPHGHFKHDRFNEDNSKLAVTLAKLGCMVVTYDMVGKGEDSETPHEDKYNNAIQLHNSIRILDYICSLDYTDKERIAVTGASGGGTQAMMLGAVDSRIKVSIPVCMLSASFNGGCLCENGMGYFEGEGYTTTTAEIGAMFAPKDMLVISIGSDWTKNTPKVEFPYLQKVYDFYGARDKVKNIHFEQEEHNYGSRKRAAAVEYLCALFKLDISKYDETKISIPHIEDLKSYTSEHSRPNDALTQPKEIYAQMLEYYSTQ